MRTTNQNPVKKRNPKNTVAKTFRSDFDVSISIKPCVLSGFCAKKYKIKAPNPIMTNKKKIHPNSKFLSATFEVLTGTGFTDGFLSWFCINDSMFVTLSCWIRCCVATCCGVGQEIIASCVGAIIDWCWSRFGIVEGACIIFDCGVFTCGESVETEVVGIEVFVCTGVFVLVIDTWLIWGACVNWGVWTTSEGPFCTTTGFCSCSATGENAWGVEGTGVTEDGVAKLGAGVFWTVLLWETCDCGVTGENPDETGVGGCEAGANDTVVCCDSFCTWNWGCCCHHIVFCGCIGVFFCIESSCFPDWADEPNEDQPDWEAPNDAADQDQKTGDAGFSVDHVSNKSPKSISFVDIPIANIKTCYKYIWV